MKRFLRQLDTPLLGTRENYHAWLRSTVDETISTEQLIQYYRGLLKDLKSRGLLEETLVVWTGEFGRTPFAQGTNGRDHNPSAGSMWMAGAGIKGGTIFGRTDDYGYRVIENEVSVHDIHATMMHLMGINHEHLTFRFGGRDFRLTDVHGHVIKDILT